MITLKPGQWGPILERIKSEYPVSVWGIRWKMREVLGFTVRRGDGWTRKGINSTTGQPYFAREPWVYLDFYDDVKETFFRMKYL
jgi:hypothetical protein